MNGAAPFPCTPLSRPLATRVLDSLAHWTTLRAARRGMSAWERPGALTAVPDTVRTAIERWKAWHRRRQEARELALLVELSPHALRDMGAPEWLQADAAAWRAAEQLRWDHARAGLGFRTGPW